MSVLKPGVNLGISNKDYHADTVYLSSSNLKLILKSAEQFYKEKILGEKVVEDKPAFQEGSYVHSLILEPEKIAEEYAFFEGWKKQGKDFEKFKEQAGKKTILSKPQTFRCNKYFEAYKKLVPAQELLKGGFPEYTMCCNILDVPIKVRADYINIEQGYIVDVKTTGHESSLDIFKHTVKDYGYDLSAALYCQAAHDVHKKLFDFYFIVISKADFECHIYKTSSKTLNDGHALVNKAIVKYKKCLETGIWKDEPVALNSFDKMLLVHDYEIREV